LFLHQRYAAAVFFSPVEMWCTVEFSTVNVCTVGSVSKYGVSPVAISWKSVLS
jgi:hypothetical protein